MNKGYVRYGLMYGACSIILSILSIYVLYPSISLGLMMVLGFIINVTFMVLACRHEKRRREGILNYGEALIVCMLNFFIGFSISYFIGMLLMSFDPGYLEKTLFLSTEWTGGIMDMFGAPEEIKLEMEDQVAEQLENFNIWSMIPNYISALIFGILQSLVVAIFTKSSNS